MDVRALTDEEARREAVPILRQLWAEKSPADVLDWTGADDYHCFGGYVDDELVAVAGVLVAGVLHHARHAWLYDLVVDEPHRGEGHGTELLRFVESWADEEGCAFLALASPEAKTDTHDYYENRGYEKWGYVIEKEL